MNKAFANPHGDPSAADQAEFVLRLYFGEDDDKLRLAIRRAYQDFSRTLHGIGDYPEVRSKADAFLHHTISHLVTSVGTLSQVSFDEWHEKASKDLCKIYIQAGYKTFYLGQAQKWINMALKYVFVFGESRLPGYKKWYPNCHIPIDNVILAKDEFRSLRSYQCAWSRISDYDDYMAFQLAVRRNFPNTSPLAIEFWIWQRNT